MEEIFRRAGRRQRRRRDQHERDQQLLIGPPQHLVGFKITGAEIGAEARHQTRSSSSMVPNKPQGLMLITTSRIRNGKASLSTGSMRRTVRYCASATMKAPTTAPRRLSRPPTSAA